MNTIFKHILLTIILLNAVIFLNAEGKPKKIISFVKSAAIPGWGELSQNHKSGYLFLSNEIALILGYQYFQQESKNKINKSILFAHNKAGISTTINNEEYRLMIGKYLSSGYASGGYNESIVKTAKSLYPDNLQNQTDYIMENILPEDVYWSWDSKANQKKYLIMRKDSNILKDYAKAVSGAIIVNHIVSAFNAARVTKRSVEFGVNFNEELKPLLTAQYRF